ncbi:MAG: hypothetical protein ABI679_09430, partial [Gemmatimonadota bacterium]
MRNLQAAALFSAALAFGLAGCSSDNNDNELTDTQAQSAGGALAAQISSAPASFSASGLSNGDVGGGFFLARAMGVKGIPAAPRVLLAPCPAVDDATDTDGDGVPDNATITFVKADCSTASFEVSGTIQIIDPSTTAVGYTGTFADFLAKLIGTGGNFASIELDGSHSVLGTPASATLSENLVTTVNASDNGQTLTGVLTNNWSISFTPAQGQNLDMGVPLPDGDLSFNGSFHYNVNGEQFTFGIVTQTALAYDSSCDPAQGWPFTTGEVRARVGGPNGRAYVKVTYNGCGVAPTVVFVGT